MNEPLTIVSVASWEDRFELGTKRLIDEHHPASLHIFYLEEYLKWSKPNLDSIQKHCEQNKVNIYTTGLSYDNPSSSWHLLFSAVQTQKHFSNNILIDISTMPREIIWSLFNICRDISASVSYIYNSPKNYHAEWLSKDPGRPRIVFKLGGIAEFGLPTSLLIVSGYDMERIRQMVFFYEPNNIVICVQQGEQFENQKRNVENCSETFKKNSNIIICNVDAYSSDHGFSVINYTVNELCKNTNVIMSSLGPKLSAVALYRVHINNQRTALAYAPSNDFNIEYSSGIGEQFTGKLIY
jgi:hypothetical protein